MTGAFQQFKKAGRLVVGASRADHPREGPWRHAPLDHAPVWNFVDPAIASLGEDRPLFAEYGPDTDPDRLLGQTGLVVLLGAGDSRLWRALMARDDLLVFVFEPDRRFAKEFIDGLDPGLAKARNVFFVSGRPPGFGLFLEKAFTTAVFERGFPAFFVERAYRDRAGELFADVVERLEMLYYRYRLYPLESYGLNRSLPLRRLAKGFYFDQQKHFFENIPEYLARPGTGELAGRLPGATAVLAGAGPSLAERLPWLKRVADKVVVICVNTALRALVQAGIEPHVCVTVDHAEHTEKAFHGLPALGRTVHAAHCLAPFAPQVFSRICWCGQVLPRPYPGHPTPAWYGSVLTMGWSLAELMGCSSCVFVGADLSSEDPWNMRYSRGTHMAENGPARQSRPLSGRFPQLYPVATVAGKQRYTTLNFRDVGLWLSARLEVSNLSLVNTSRDSILTAGNMAFDPEPVPENPVDARAALRGVGRARAPEAGTLDQALEGVRHGLATWAEIGKAAREAAELPDMDEKALELFAFMESQSVSYMVQRFRDYDNKSFHQEFFNSSDPGDRWRALRGHFEYVADMCGCFLDLLGRAEERLLAIDTP